MILFVLGRPEEQGSGSVESDFIIASLVMHLSDGHLLGQF